MKIIFEKLKLFNATANNLLTRDKEIENTKLGWAIKKFTQKNAKIFDDFNLEAELLRVDHALEDEKTHAILKDEKGNYRYSKESLKELLRELNKLDEKWNKKEVEVEPYICKTPPELTEEEKEIFSGLVI